MGLCEGAPGTTGDKNGPVVIEKQDLNDLKAQHITVIRYA